MSSSVHLLLAILLVLANAFFVAAEFALVKVRHTRLEVLAKKGHPIARLAKKMVEQLDPYLSATQLGITLASLGLGWVGEPAFAKMLNALFSNLTSHFSPATIHSIAFTMAFMIISTLHIVLGELVPKSIAIRTAETICLLVAVPMRIFYIIFFPFMWGLNGLSNFILRLLHVPAAGGPSRAHSEEELKLVIEDSFEEGIIGSRKRLLIDKALDFSHKTIHDIMVPATQMICFYLDESVHDNLKQAKEWGHTRFPLCTSHENPTVLGFVHMKDIIWSLEEGDVINLFDLRRPILFFPPETKLDNALREFQKKTIHMGIVQGADGSLLGLVTLEDVIEQLVGEIEDEFDADVGT